MAATTAPPLAERHEDELTHRQIVTILLALMSGMFLAALDQTIVSTAIRTIADDLKGLDQQAWVTTAYLITSTISTPIYGKLSDLYGRKTFFQAAIVIFVLGSLACSFATSMYMLAAFRAFQGLGAGGLMSLALAIIGDIVPPRERSKYQGYFVAVFGTSSVLGPLIGGFFADQSSLLGITGWRWVFLVNVPIGIASFALVALTLHLHHVRHEARIDWWGALTLVVALVPLLIIAEQGQQWGWTSGRAWTCYAIGVVGLLAFVFAEYRAGNDALLPLRIFRNRTIVVALLGGFVIGAGMFGGMMLIPQFYLQIIHGSSPTKAGLQMLPMVLGMMIASIASGQLMTRTGRVKIFPIIGVVIMTVGLISLSRVTADTDLWKVMCLMFVFGFGLGNTMQPLILAVQAAAEPREIGMATSAATFFRQIGGTLGVAIFLSIMFNTVGDNIKNAFTDAAGTASFRSALQDQSLLKNPGDAAIIKGITMHDQSALGRFLAGAKEDSSIINQLDPRLAHPFKVGFADSMSTVFLCAGVAVALGLLALVFMPNVTLSRVSAAARAAEARRVDEDGTVVAEAPAAPALDAQGEQAVATEHAGSGATAGAAGADRPAPDVAAGTVSALPEDDGLAVSGVVTQNGGSPLTGARVTLADQTGRQVGRTTSGADGRYHLPVSNGGTYLLIVAAEGVAPSASLVAVGDRGVRSDVVLAGTGWISGRVTQRELESELSHPVVGALITLTDVTGEVMGSQRTSEDGGYVFEGLAAGSYVLTAQSGAHRPLARPVDVSGSDATVCDLVLSVGGRLEGLVLAAADRLPVRHATVTLTDSSGQVAGTAVTGSDGRYEFGDLEAGSYVLIAAGYAPVAREVTVADGRINDVAVLLGDGAEQADRDVTRVDDSGVRGPGTAI